MLNNFSFEFVFVSETYGTMEQTWEPWSLSSRMAYFPSSLEWALVHALTTAGTGAPLSILPCPCPSTAATLYPWLGLAN